MPRGIKIKVKIDGVEATVPRSAYITAKTKQLRKFGYEGLTEKAVSKQLDLLLAGKKWTDVIGGFMEDEIVRDSERNDG